MADAGLESLKVRSNSYQLRFVSALLGGLLLWTPGWWAAVHSYKAALVASTVGFFGCCLYALVIWVLWIDIRVQIRKARARGA